MFNVILKGTLITVLSWILTHVGIRGNEIVDGNKQTTSGVGITKL